MTTATTTTHTATVHHSQHVDPHLLRLVHGYRPVCTCGFRGRVTGDERAAMGEVARHGRGK